MQQLGTLINHRILDDVTYTIRRFHIKRLLEFGLVATVRFVHQRHVTFSETFDEVCRRHLKRFRTSKGAEVKTFLIGSCHYPNYNIN
jgi:hypothetical protein